MVEVQQVGKDCHFGWRAARIVVSQPKMAIFSDLLYLNHSASLEATCNFDSQTERLDYNSIF